MTFATTLNVNGHDIVDVKLNDDFPIHLFPIQKVHRGDCPFNWVQIPGQVKQARSRTRWIDCR